MKKIILILGFLATIQSFASTMCAVNDTVAVVLDPSVKGTNNGDNNTLSTWWAQFPYGRVSGISACIDTNHGKGQGGTVSKLTDSNGNRVMGGEKNGGYCWCKITHPMSSLWAFSSNAVSAANCASICVYYCGSYVRTNGSLRTGLFGSIEQ